MVERVEDLRLYGVEVVEPEERLEPGVVQGGDGQGLEVEERRVRRVALGEDQVLERDGAIRLTA